MEGRMTTINATEARLSTHEEVCAICYEQINARLKRLEAIMLKTAGVMLLSMGGTIFSAVWILK
jgi:histone acetyltransferase (RNA polymerase elongator complex component)